MEKCEKSAKKVPKRFCPLVVALLSLSEESNMQKTLLGCGKTAMKEGFTCNLPNTHDRNARFGFRLVWFLPIEAAESAPNETLWAIAQFRKPSFFFIKILHVNYRHIRDYCLSNSKTFQDGNGNGNSGKLIY